MVDSIVFDTSVLIAGLRSSTGASFAMLEMIGKGAIEINLSVPLILEYEAVARRQARELGLTFQDVNEVLDYLCKVGHHHSIYYLWRPVLRDPKDDMLLELAVEAGVGSIVTHNTKDFLEARQFGIRAIAPRDYLAELRKGKQERAK